MRKAFIQLHLAVILAGFTGVLGKLITLNEGLLVWYRLLITVITLLILLLLQRKLQQVSRRDLLAITGVGAVAALHWVSFFGCIKYANVSVALVCLSAIGFFTAIFEPLITAKRFNRIELLLGLLAITGIYLIFHFDPAYKLGIGIGIFSALMGSLFPIFNRQLLQRIRPDSLTMLELAGGWLFITLLMPFYLHHFPADHLLPTWSDLGWLLVLSWLCTVLAFNFSMNALKRISAFTVNLTYSLEPLYGIGLAFIVYREDKLLTSAFYVGLFLILCSVLLQTWLVYREKRKLAAHNS